MGRPSERATNGCGCEDRWGKRIANGMADLRQQAITRIDGGVAGGGAELDEAIGHGMLECGEGDNGLAGDGVGADKVGAVCRGHAATEVTLPVGAGLDATIFPTGQWLDLDLKG